MYVLAKVYVEIAIRNGTGVLSSIRHLQRHVTRDRCVISAAKQSGNYKLFFNIGFQTSYTENQHDFTLYS